jgi:ribose transport system ATP-binding protein
LVKTLSIPEQQVVEIIKSLIVESAHTYVFDEPTSSLGDEDVGKLFKLIEGLRQQGKAVVYVSHKFDEIFRISNRITILRDGNMVGTGTAESYNAESIIRLMVGRSLDHIYPPHGQPSEKVLFDVNNLSAGPKCKHVSFKLYQGEILGLFGLVGAGRTEIARAIVGANKKQSGDLSLNGKKINIKKIQDSISNGVFYLTENRKIEGLFLKMSILDNVVVTDLDSVSSSGLLRHNLAKKKTLSAMEHLHVKAHSSAQLVQSLSGGNQQKVMVTKWLERQPKVLILDEPTRGIDVGAKAEIHQLLRDLSNKGVGVIVISSELPEIVGLSDRVLVVYDGSIMAELRKEQITEDMIMHYASGLEVNERLG